MTEDAFSIELNGIELREVVRASVTRDLGDISGSFEVEIRDARRAIRTFVWSGPPEHHPRVRPQLKARIRIGDDLVLVGFVDDIRPRATEGGVNLAFTGRDVTMDLVDCAAAPFGPAEYRSITLTEFARRICAPFKITVRAEIDVGAPFPKIAVDTAETAMSAIEKMARRRGVLVTSDGVGALVLTRSGKRKAEGVLSFPGEIEEEAALVSFKERFSHYIVKGQAAGAGGARASSPALDANAAPLSAPPPEEPESGSGEDEGGTEGRGVSIRGMARDAEVERWRPKVELARTASTQADAQKTAEWRMRVARGRSTSLTPQTRGWRQNAGEGALWRLNERVEVEDHYADIVKEMLIAGVTYEWGDRGATTRFRVVGPEAYDLIAESQNRAARTRRPSGGSGRPSGGGSRGLDSRALPLSGDA